MKIDFKDYFLSEFKHANTGPFRLYHDWVYDQVFGNAPAMTAEQEKLIKMVLFKTTYSCLWVGEIIKVDYQRECEKRARASFGPLQGKVISKLDNKDRSLIPPLIELTKSGNEFIAKSARAKIEQIKFYTDKE